ncbi:hypothetical protein IFM89_033719 [Coptis chinensis]|uniref:Eukaryotic translation initiation factor 3 subunit C N-terminal domain-containing protein n=1 Tax=Coptis chinensis TaxID=261450 RepID=A0A835HX12_9MAGN|nr:hypothetical protein IFM89_033719 [Coptis chinensis]
MERRRQMPYHLYRNLEFLDAVNLVCAMLLEVPDMAMKTGDAKGKVLCKTFCKLLKQFETWKSLKPGRGELDGTPPCHWEGSGNYGRKEADALPHAHSWMLSIWALSKGDFQKSFNVIKSFSFWRFVENQDYVLEMLKTKIKDEALRIGLFT